MKGGIDINRMKYPRKRFGMRKCKCGKLYKKSITYRSNMCKTCKYLRKKYLQDLHNELRKKVSISKVERPKTIYANQVQVSDYSRHEVKTIWDMV
jgi:hypothetical protein